MGANELVRESEWRYLTYLEVEASDQKGYRTSLMTDELLRTANCSSENEINKMTCPSSRVEAIRSENRSTNTGATFGFVCLINSARFRALLALALHVVRMEGLVVVPPK